MNIKTVIVNFFASKLIFIWLLLVDSTSLDMYPWNIIYT